MKLSEKMVILRNRKELTQAELGELAGVKKRSIIYYENDQRMPNDEILLGIAKGLDVSPEFLLDDSQSIELTKEEIFIKEAKDKFGSKGALEAGKTIKQIKALMSGGELDENDKEAFFQVMQEIYFDSSEKAKKFGKNTD